MSEQRLRAVVVGGGIGGLAAARFLADTESFDVTVLEATDRVGGKLRAEEVAGVRVDVGAEAMLNRRPEGVDLARAVGLPIVHPTGATSRIWSYDQLRPLPRSLMGVPLDATDLAAAGVLSDTGLQTALAEADQPARAVEGDVSIGDLVAERFGDEVVDRIVEPLLGGVYAGHAREISVRAGLPQLPALLARGSVMSRGDQVAPTYGPGAEAVPVFAAIPGGMARFTEALAADPRLTVRTGAVVRDLHATDGGFDLIVGPTTNPERVRADKVVLAIPSAPAARLLGAIAPVAAHELAALEAASVAVITFAYRAADLPADLDQISGVLVPPVEQRDIKASTLSYAKWDWVRGAGGDLRFLRTSLGRHREESSLQRSDEELVEVSRKDLAALLGITAEPVAAHVQRWGSGLPQYAVGHLDRVARLRADVARVPGLAVCGAAYDGVGIPAVIASARRAVDQLDGGQ